MLDACQILDTLATHVHLFHRRQFFISDIAVIAVGLRMQVIEEVLVREVLEGRLHAVLTGPFLITVEAMSHHRPALALGHCYLGSGDDVVMPCREQPFDVHRSSRDRRQIVDQRSHVISHDFVGSEIDSLQRG